MYLGHSPTNAGSFIFLDDIASGFNGSETQFTLQVGGVSITPNTQNLLIALDGIIQQAPDAYTTSGSTITFTGAVPSGTDFYGILMGQSASIGQGTIGADELKITGNGTSGQLVKSDGDSTYSYLSTTDITSVGTFSSLTTSGNVGIGMSPDMPLNVKVATNEVLRVRSDSGVQLTARNEANSADVAMLLSRSSFTFQSGNVGVGASIIKFDVQDNSTWASRILNTNAGGQALLVRTDATNDATALGVYANGAYRLLVTETSSTFSNQTLIKDGASNALSLAFSGDTDTGIYRGGDGATAFVQNGGIALELQSSLTSEFRGLIKHKGTSNSDYGNTAFETRSGNNSQGLKISHGGGNGKLELFSGNQSRTQFYANQITANVNGLEIKTTDAQSLTLGTNNTTRVLIDGSTGEI